MHRNRNMNHIALEPPVLYDGQTKNFHACHVINILQTSVAEKYVVDIAI